MTGVGESLLAALAESELADSDRWDADEDLGIGLQRAEAQLMDRQAREESRRVSENRALFDTRRISLRETHHRKVKRIEGIISTLRSNGKENMVRLQEAQLRNQARLVAAKEAELENRATGSLLVEKLAVCVVEAED
jgi:hypothetical protein